MSARDYIVTFGRIGRTRDITMHLRATDADQLAEHIHAEARKFLRSKDYDVMVDLDEGTGIIFCGAHIGGSCTISEPAADEVDLMALDGAA